MKAAKFLLPLMVLLLAGYVFSAPATPPPPAPTLGAIRINLLDGDVQVKTEETDDWVPASINMPLQDGDRLWVPEGGRTELALRDGSFVRLDQKTAFDILRVDRDSFQFYLAEGRAFIHFRGLKDSTLQVDTAISSSRAYDPAVFRVDVMGEGLTEVSVYRGSIYTESQDGKTTIAEGNTLSLKGDTYAELSPLAPPDEWEEWNKERDRKFAQAKPPAPYLPEELQVYSPELEENGRWVRVPQYGFVWTPTVVVAAEWAPYRVGRWIWRGGDYVWISYEPWGWVPYHYGRWAFVASVGWCWVPPVRGAVYWGPGFVGWVQTPTYVSWVPLAPGEIYYGHGYYGPHSVNITTVNITNINVTRIQYRNIHVHNAVTIIHRDTFVTGRHVDIHIRENPFLRERIHIGRPDIRPERATMMPVIREIHPDRRPPQVIREIRVRELAERRPLVREREASVFRRDAPHKELTVRPREGTFPRREPEKLREHWPTRQFERPREQPRQPGFEKPRRDFQAPQRDIRKPPSEPRAPQREFDKPRSRAPEPPGTEKASPKLYEKPRTERSPGPERDLGKPGVSKPGRPMESRPETKPQWAPQREREGAKPLESRPVEKGFQGPKPMGPGPTLEKGGPGVEHKPVQKGVGKPGESRPEHGKVEFDKR